MLKLLFISVIFVFTSGIGHCKLPYNTLLKYYSYNTNHKYLYNGGKKYTQKYKNIKLIKSNGEILFSSDRGATYTKLIENNIINPNYSEEIVIYPNPVYNSFEIQIPEGICIESILIFNSIGVEMHNIDFQANQSKALIFMESVPSGIYKVVFKMIDGTTISKKVVKI